MQFKHQFNPVGVALSNTTVGTYIWVNVPAVILYHPFGVGLWLVNHVFYNLAIPSGFFIRLSSFMRPCHAFGIVRLVIWQVYGLVTPPQIPFAKWIFSVPPNHPIFW